MAFPAMNILPCDVLSPAEARIKVQCPQAGRGESWT